MSRDFEREAAVTPCVNELAAGRPAQGNAAEDEGPGIETQVLPAELALLADEMDSFELLEAAASDSDGRQGVSDASEHRIRLGAGRCLAFCSRSWRSVREIGQEEPSNDRNVGNRVLALNREQNRNIGPKLLNFGTLERSPELPKRESMVHGLPAWLGFRQPGKFLVIARILSMSAREKRRPLPSLGTSGYLPVLNRQRMVSAWTPKRGQRSPVR